VPIAIPVKLKMELGSLEAGKLHPRFTTNPTPMPLPALARMARELTREMNLVVGVIACFFN